MTRAIVHRTMGLGHGPIRRLMSPGDLGQALKPFVFLDLFDIAADANWASRLHPHSGIATVTLLIRGKRRFDDPLSATSGVLDYGGVEHMRAGTGVWHGEELINIEGFGFRGFQLWLALPPHVELAPPLSQYVEACDIPVAGPAHVIAGTYGRQTSPLCTSPEITYLLVTLAPGEKWVFQPAPGQTVAWLAVENGMVMSDGPVVRGEMAIFEKAEAEIRLIAGTDEPATFIFGSAVPHDHDLVLGDYSVHTSPAALAQGESRIGQIAEEIARRQFDERSRPGSIHI